MAILAKFLQTFVQTFRAFGPGTTCWPGGVPKCSTGVGVKKWPPGGVDLLFTPPTHTYAPTYLKGDLPDTEVKCLRTEEEVLSVERENTWNPLEVYIMHLLRLIRLAQSLFSLLFYFICRDKEKQRSLCVSAGGEEAPL